MQELKESINLIQKEMGVESDSDSEEEKELPDTARTDQMAEASEENPKKEYRDFKFAEVFASIEDTINKSETKVTKKDLMKAVKTATKGTKAEKIVNRVCKRVQGKCGPRQFFKEAMKAWKHQGAKGKCGRKRDAAAPDSEDAQKVVHPGITCDGCQVGPVTGVRYKCVECSDFDLCELCEANGIHSHHTFLKVKYPQKIDLNGTYRTEGPSHPPFPHPGMDVNAHPHHPPHMPPHHPHGGPFAGFGHGRGRGGRGGRGGFGGGPQMRRMMKEFMKTFAGGSDSELSSGEEQEREDRRKANLSKRPAILKMEGVADILQPGATIIVEVEVQNQTRWPCPLRSIQKLDGNMEFEQIALDEKLKFEDKTTFSIPVTMPASVGEYSLALGFFGNKGTVTGQKVDLKFTVVDPEASAI